MVEVVGICDLGDASEPLRLASAAIPLADHLGRLSSGMHSVRMWPGHHARTSASLQASPPGPYSTPLHTESRAHWLAGESASTPLDAVEAARRELEKGPAVAVSHGISRSLHASMQPDPVDPVRPVCPPAHPLY